MTNEPQSLFDQPPVFHEVARRDDPSTSHQAAKMPFRRESQRHLLLKQYDGWNLIDEEAAVKAGIVKGCPWKRCSELREMGFIEPTGEEKLSSSKAAQRICRITEAGQIALSTVGGVSP